MIFRYPTMSRSRVFRRRISIGFAVVASLCFFVSVLSFIALRRVIHAKDLVISDYAHNQLSVRDLEVFCEQGVSSRRAYLLTGDSDFEAKALRARREFSEATASLRSRTREEERAPLDRVIDTEKAHWDAMSLVINEADGNRDLRKLARYFEETVIPKRDELRHAFRALIATEEQQLQKMLDESSRAASRMSIFVVMIGISAVAVAGALFALSRRTLGRLALAEQEVRDLNQTLEGRVADRTAELTRTVRDLEGFAYTVAHDLRAPLRAMSGLSRLVIEDFGKDIRDPGSEYLRRIDDAAKRMDRLIVGLLDYSRLSYSDIDLKPVNLDEAISAVLKSSESEVEAKKAVVQIEAPLGMALANEALLRQVLQNLISNATKFVEAGRIPRVRVWSEEHPGGIRLWVEDSGIGIASEHRELIFGVFQRLNRAEDYAGTGIGLAIVRKAVERMGGRVGVESQPGRGSQFWVELRAS